MQAFGHKLENNPDLIIIERLEEKSEITISQIHDLQKNLPFQPLKHKDRFVIFKDAQHLNTSSQNALLKTLEEPPANTYFVLCIDNEKKLLPTILSRCEIVQIRNSKSETQNANQDLQILEWIKEGSIKDGFAWAATIKDRQEAIKVVTELILMRDFSIIRKLQKAKKYLEGNCNVRLTLENLFI